MLHGVVTFSSSGFLGLCLPCVLTALTAKRLGESPWLYCFGVATFVCPMMVALRVKARQRLGIDGDVRDDAVLSSPCCVFCSNCQVANEMREKGAWDTQHKEQ